MNLMTIALTVAVAASARAADGKEAEPAPGQKLYAAKCASCHGKDGKGSAVMAKMFKLKAEELDLTSEKIAKDKDEDVIKVIAEGRKKMPPFKEKLKEDEIGAVTAYIRSLAPAEKPESKGEEKAAPKPEAKPAEEK